MHLTDGRVMVTDGGLYGPGSCDVSYGAVTVDVAQGTFAANVNLAALTLNGAAAGTKYVAGVFTDGVPVTSANVDASGGLQNPRTGARYAVT
jgi:hypothetical protein